MAIYHIAFKERYSLVACFSSYICKQQIAPGSKGFLAIVRDCVAGRQLSLNFCFSF